MLLAFYKNIDFHHYIMNVFCIISAEFICNKTVVLNIRFVKFIHGFLKISKMLILHILAVHFRDKILSDCRRQEGCTSRSKIRLSVLYPSFYSVRRN